jgi:hypothetical protein
VYNAIQVKQNNLSDLADLADLADFFGDVGQKSGSGQPGIFSHTTKKIHSLHTFFSSEKNVHLPFFRDNNAVILFSVHSSNDLLPAPVRVFFTRSISRRYVVFSTRSISLRCVVFSTRSL